MKVEVNKLKKHPFNGVVFKDLDTNEFESLKRDIKDRGLQLPIEITSDNVIITGHQRVEVFKKLNFEYIEAKVREDLDTEDKIKEHLIKDNILRRQLTEVEIARAGKELEVIESKKAKVRQLSTLKEGEESPDVANLPQREEIGRTRDKVAENFGISGKTYELYKKAEEILSKDDELKEKYKENWEKGEVTARKIVTESIKRELNKETGMDMSWLRYSTVWNFQDKGLIGNGLSNLPSQIIQNIIYYYSKKGDLIIDPFAGSGLTKEVCDIMDRKCFCSDINPLKEFIKKWDLTKGYPIEAKESNLIFLDPPYWKMVDYGKNSLDKLNLQDFLKEIENIAKNSFNTLKVGGIVALIIMPLKIDSNFIDLSFECYNLFKKAQLQPIQRFCVPVVKQPHQTKKGEFISTLRDLIIFKKNGSSK